jgi:hypothetical protein
MNLIDWTELYARHKFMAEVTVKNSIIRIKKKGVTTCFTVVKNLSEIPATSFVAKATNWLVVENSKKSVTAILEVWKVLVEKKVRVLFVDVVKNVSFGVIPAIHVKIVEPENIEKSLISLSNQL